MESFFKDSPLLKIWILKHVFQKAIPVHYLIRLWSIYGKTREINHHRTFIFRACIRYLVMRSCQRLICGQIEMSTLKSGFDVDIMMINCVSVAQYENLLAFGIVLCKTTFLTTWVLLMSWSSYQSWNDVQTIFYSNQN